MTTRPALAAWSPTPMFQLRRSCVASVTAAMPPGRFLEVGAGTGALTVEFLERGFSGAGFDLGPATRAALRERLAGFGGRLAVVDALAGLERDAFDYLFAFEVLEHIEDDAGALREWREFLKPGGICVVSVPAHARKFGHSDAAVGHFRRYERAALARLFENAGFHDIRIVCYGFPLGNVTRAVADLLKLGAAPAAEGRADRTVRSGVERPAVTRALSPLFNRALLAPFLALQRPFFGLDIGEGYVATAVRPQTAR